MATCLSTLTSLKSLHLGFDSFQSYPDLLRRPFSSIRSVLTALVILRYDGMIKYFEEFVAWIDTPRLSLLSTNFFNDIDFNTQELNRFISRTTTLGAYDEAHLIFCFKGALVMLHQSHPDPRMVGIKSPDMELSTVAQICTLSSCLLLTMANLYIDGELFSSHLRDNHNNTGWLDLLLPFTTVKNLYLSKLFLTRIALVLQELTGERTREVLPALQNVLLGGFQPSEPVEGIAQFISARQLTNHPVSISVWDRNPKWDMMW